MIDAQLSRRLGFSPVWIQHGHVRESEAMMLVIIGEKSERRVLILNLRFKDSLVPLQHFLITSGHINNVR